MLLFASYQSCYLTKKGAGLNRGSLVDKNSLFCEGNIGNLELRVN